MRADATDLAVFVEALAVKLEGALPGRVSVVRKGGGLFSRARRVREISVDMGDRRYHLAATAAGVETSCRSEVRGIVIKSEPLDQDDWIAGLSRELAVGPALTNLTGQDVVLLLNAGYPRSAWSARPASSSASSTAGVSRCLAAAGASSPTSR